MFTSVTIENFRCFERLELQKLGRVNLLVGKNNSGKTSVLEAIRMVCEGTDSLIPFFEALEMRHEFVQNEIGSIVREGQVEVDTRCLFRGRQLLPGDFFRILARTTEGASSEFKVTVCESDPRFSLDNHSESELELSILASDLSKSSRSTRMSLAGVVLGGSTNPKRPFQLIRKHFYSISEVKSLFFAASTFDRRRLIPLFESIVLTPEEEMIVEALKVIDPEIERVATNSVMHDFKVLMGGNKYPLQLGSLGEGVFRMLGIAISLASVKGGFLFIDDIDTGLHYSTMEKMWELVWETAKKLDVQVFATTHSDDCWKALAAIAEREDAKTEGVSIQRIEKGNPKAINFTNREIVIAAERLGEVR